MGTQYGRNVQKGAELFAWIDSLARSVTLVNLDGATAQVRGLDTLEFTLQHKCLLNATMNPENVRPPPPPPRTPPRQPHPPARRSARTTRSATAACLTRRAWRRAFLS